jgi:hypothetical protein
MHLLISVINNMKKQGGIFDQARQSIDVRISIDRYLKLTFLGHLKSQH